MTVHDALRAVVREQKNGYAITYAKHALTMCHGEGLQRQILYVLDNLGGWRGDRAREVKAVLRVYSKGGL